MITDEQIYKAGNEGVIKQVNETLDAMETKHADKTINQRGEAITGALLLASVVEGGPKSLIQTLTFILLTLLENKQRLPYLGGENPQTDAGAVPPATEKENSVV